MGGVLQNIPKSSFEKDDDWGYPHDETETPNLVIDPKKYPKAKGRHAGPGPRLRGYGSL